MKKTEVYKNDIKAVLDKDSKYLFGFCKWYV